MGWWRMVLAAVKVSSIIGFLAVAALVAAGGDVASWQWLLGGAAVLGLCAACLERVRCAAGGHVGAHRARRAGRAHRARRAAPATRPGVQ